MGHGAWAWGTSMGMGTGTGMGMGMGMATYETRAYACTMPDDACMRISMCTRHGAPVRAEVCEDLVDGGGVHSPRGGEHEASTGHLGGVAGYLR